MAEGSEPIKQDVVEELLRQADSGASTPGPVSSGAAANTPGPASPSNSGLGRDEIEALLNQNASA